MAAREPWLSRPVGEREIRLIDIEPANDFNEDVRINLRVVSLDTGERYQALSYAWESQDATEVITCGTHEVKVTPTLLAALKRIREKNGWRNFDLVVWADGICIDQGNAAEKSQQVQMMGEIFSKARRLIIWLGEASIEEQEEFLNALDLSMPIKQRRQSLLDLSRKQWFQRRWVIQEVLLSKRGRRHALLGPTWKHFLALLAAYEQTFRTRDTCPELTHAPLLQLHCTEM